MLEFNATIHTVEIECRRKTNKKNRKTYHQKKKKKSIEKRDKQKV